jgi:glycosyltransferase involved in cell wall biosynthesis
MSTTGSHNGSVPIATGNGSPGPTLNGSRPNTMTVSLVIPAKDEAENVAWVLRRLPAGVDEVILVDGHSTDDTVEVARAICDGIIIVEERGPGKGAAMRTGMDLATGDVIVLLDADGSMDPREMHRFIAAASECDVVKGSRFMERGGSEDISRVRRVGNRLLLGLVNLLYGARMTDLCYGYCAVRRSALPALALRSQGFEIETELTARALRAGLRFREVPSFEAPRRYGTSHLRTVRDGSRVLRTLLVERVCSPRGVDAAPPAALNGASSAAVVDAALSATSLAQE